MSNGIPHPPRSRPPFGSGPPGRGGSGRGGEKPIRFEIPRRAAPRDITRVIGDYHTLSAGRSSADIPPGHRFQLYFHGMADRGEVDAPEGRENRDERQIRQKAADQGDWETLSRKSPDIKEAWVPLKNQKRVALKAAAAMGKTASVFLSALANRAEALGDGEQSWRREGVLIAPLATGLGNPHPVENGFAFLSPYGVPYLAGSGVKGVIRRAAEELALIEPGPGWTLAHVWALFGFEETGAIFPSGNERNTRSIWRDAYGAWVQELRATDSPVLNVWLEAIREQLPQEARKLPPPDLLFELSRSQPLRRAIHWQGMLGFYDAFPDEKANIVVDILNPHHRNYYECNGTPHDAESPVPVFFLAIAPGARFTFRARALPGRDSLWQVVGDWRTALDAAFDRAREQLGFGAKTAVGYGAMAEPGASRQGTVASEGIGVTGDAGPKPTGSTPKSAPVRWDSARLKFNRANGTLTAEFQGKQAHATAPDGERLLAGLPRSVQDRIRRNEYVKAVAVVEGSKLVEVKEKG